MKSHHSFIEKGKPAFDRSGFDLPTIIASVADYHRKRLAGRPDDHAVTLDWYPVSIPGNKKTLDSHSPC